MKNKDDRKLNRPPIVTFLGHVDHGKTTILDKIRNTAVQEKEVGGITQGISVYSVNYNNNDITFIDTPGHEAFDLMRAKGGEVADIALLIVAADDGVKPQTKESIEIIKKSKSKCIVVINKVDIKGIKIDKIHRQLVAEGMNVEAMGGDIPCVEVSGKTGKGIEDLLNMILLVAEINGLKEKDKPEVASGAGIVLESTKDESMGIVTTMITLSGSFKKGCYVSYGEGEKEKIKGFTNSENKSIDELKAGYGGKLIGISKILSAGDQIYGISESGCDCSSFFQEKESEIKEGEEEVKSEEDLLSALLGGSEQVETGDVLNVIVKACSKGSLDAVLKSVEKINKEDKVVNVVNSGVGDITVSDVEFAKDSRAIIAGFSVGIDRSARDLVSKEKIIVRTYKLIYELLDEIEDAGVSLQMPTEEEKPVGDGTIKQVFTLSDGTTVLGTRVDNGEIKNGLNCRIVRGDEVIAESKIKSMRCEKERIDKATKGIDCGIMISAKGDFQEGDHVECYRIVKL
ncbi:MAG: translation initiation factor IF-2 [bacterium]